MNPLPCPFKVGDRVRAISPGFASVLPVTVTAVRPDGFDWKADEPQVFSVREGSTYQFGTCYPSGYDDYERVP